MGHLFPKERLRIGHIGVDVVTLPGALAAIETLVELGQGGRVFTPNVEHVVMAEGDARFREAYARAELTIADGMPVVWASRLLGKRLPERVAGSDVVAPLMRRAAVRGWRVFLFGGAPGVAELAARNLAAENPGLVIAGTDCSRVDLTEPPSARAEILSRVAAARPHIVLVGLGAPKQELWIDEAAPQLRPAVLLGIGAGIDFAARVAARAPRWASAAGLEWLHRLLREPKRLWRRYLLRCPRFLPVVLRSLRERDGAAEGGRP